MKLVPFHKSNLSSYSGISQTIGHWRMAEFKPSDQTQKAPYTGKRRGGLSISHPIWYPSERGFIKTKGSGLRAESESK